MAITLRLTKGSPLTYTELDDNFIYLSSSYVPNSTTSSMSVLSSSYAATASYFPAAGANTQIQYNSGSLFQAESYFAYIYQSHSLQQGDTVLAKGNYSHAEGYDTTANGNYSHAEGRLTTTTGVGSHAEGYNTLTINSYAHAEGLNTTASGEASHAEGAATKAIGDYSHAAGSNTVASGSYSYAGGLGTIASGSGQTVIGQYNTQNDATSLFIVGNGTGTGTRSDVMRVTGSIVQVTGSLSITGSAIVTGSMLFNGYQIAQTKKITLTSAQILNLNASSVTLISAIPSTAIIVDSIAYSLVGGSTSYSGNINLRVAYNGSNVISITTNGPLGGSGLYIAPVSTDMFTATNTDIIIYQGGGAATTGDRDLDVYITYRLLP